MLKGEKMSDEQKSKVSFSRKGKNLGNKNAKGKNLGNINGFKKGQKIRKGVIVSKDTRLKMRIAKLGKTSNMKGKKTPIETRKKISIGLRKHLSETGFNYSYDPKHVLSMDRKKVYTERLKSNGGLHSQGEWETLKAQYNFTCPSCHIKEPRIKLTKDHIIPASRGGSNNIENIQPLCISCNSKKHTKTIRYVL